MYRLNHVWVLGGAAAAMFAAGSQAAVTFVNANVSTNTSPTSATQSGTDGGADNLWWVRSGFGTNNEIFAASGNGGAENAPELTTTISGLTPGASYNVWVNFYDVNETNGGQHWAIQAGFTSGSLTLFANDDGGTTVHAGSTASVDASTFTYVSDPKFDDGSNRILQAGALGSAVADINGDIQVFIDDLPAAIASNHRTWYDGVSYELVPEPASVALLGLGGLCVLARRRR